MIGILRKSIATLGTPGLLALTIGLLLILPFDVFAVMQLTGWSWWMAVVALLALNLVPFAGQVIYAGLAVLGAFYLGQSNLAERRAATVPPPVASAAPTTIDNFVEWKKKIGAPAIQSECIEKARSRGLVEGRQIEQMAKVCACYGAAAINILEPSDVVDGAVQASPQLNVKMSDEARRLCKS